MRAAVRYRRGLVAERRVAQQRLHDQLNALCPGLSAPGLFLPMVLTGRHALHRSVQYRALLANNRPGARACSDRVVGARPANATAQARTARALRPRAPRVWAARRLSLARSCPPVPARDRDRPARTAPGIGH